MLHAPHPDLNEQERALLQAAPEETLRRAVRRGALSLEPITDALSPHAANVVRSMVAGERPTAPDPSLGPVPDSEEKETPPAEGPSMGAALARLITGEHEAPKEEGEGVLPEYHSLGAWPSLQRAVDDGELTVGEALDLAQTIDRALGRYLTGTRYAAP